MPIPGPVGHAVHALWRPAAPAGSSSAGSSDGGLALWAEGPRQSLHPGPDGEGHPFACPAPLLRALLEATTPALRWLAAGAEPGRAVLRLPTRGGRPTRSPEFAGPAARPVPGAGRPDLARWPVETLQFAPGPAAQLLGELFDPYPWTSMLVAEGAGPRGADVELHFGASLRWLIAVHDQAWRCVRQGSVVPALGHRDGRARAHWQPMPGADAAQVVDALAVAAPPVVLAASPPASPRTAAGLTAEVFEALVDAEVRIAMDGEPPLVAPGRERTPTPASRAARAWVRALTSPSGEVLGADPTALADLGRRLVRWYRSTPRPPGDVRLGFRLVEPEGPSPYDDMGWNTDDHWELDLVVGSTAEPALTVDAADLWAGGAALAAFVRTVPRVEHLVLDELDRAVRCWPPLREVLREARPTGLRLDRAGATDFLREGAPALADAGFAVLLPSWWRRRARLGLALTARAVDPGTVHTRSMLDRDAVVEFAWQVALGEVRLTERELETLAEATVPLVQLRGQWLVADRGEIAAALAFLRREGAGSTTVGEVLRTGLAAEPSAGGLPVVAVDVDGPVGDLLAGRAPAEVPGPPEGFGAAFGTTLRPYQQRGLAWLTTLERCGLGGVLADDMGLGKTVQTLALLVADRLRGGAPGAGRGPTLLVCPMSLVGNWQHEAARFAPGLRVHVHHGAGRNDVDAGGADLASAAPDADLVITTFAVAHRDVELLRAIAWHRVVVDEAHQIKNRLAAQSKAVRSLPARHRLALTGTPVENRLADLHAVLDLVNPGLFGSAEAFKERYAVPIERHGDERAAADLRRRTRPLLLRRLKSDPAVIGDLPDKIEMTVRCTLTVEQAALYRAVVRDVLQRLQNRRGPARRGVVLASLSKLKQVCNHPAQFLRDGSRIDDRSGKVARLEEILEEVVATGDRALCFTQFAAFGALLQPYLTRRLGTEVLFLHGGQSRAERERLVARFQADDGPAVFLLSLKAGGAGLNLTAAGHVVHLDRWWNPAVEDQATDRAHRIGQRRDVQVRRLVCAGTIEERIDEIVAGKRALADAVVTPGEGWLVDLPTEAFAELITLDGVPEAGDG